MARPERFELPTPRFVVWCSIQLSYGRLLRRSRGKCPRTGQSPRERGHNYRLRPGKARCVPRRRKSIRSISAGRSRSAGSRTGPAGRRA